MHTLKISVTVEKNRQVTGVQQLCYYAKRHTGVISGYSIRINKVQGSILPLAQRRHCAYGNTETEAMIPPPSINLPFQQHFQRHNQNSFHFRMQMLHHAANPLFNLRVPSSTFQRGQLKLHLCTTTLFNTSFLGFCEELSQLTIPLFPPSP